jgi:hypothetical protein
VVIDVSEADIGFLEGLGEGLVEEFYHVTGGDASLGIEAEVAVDLDAARGDELADLRPGVVGEKALERGGERVAAWLIA